MFPGKAGTDIYLDAAGVPAVVNTALAAAKKGATLGIVGVHKEPVPVEFVNVMSNEITIVGSHGISRRDLRGDHAISSRTGRNTR